MDPIAEPIAGTIVEPAAEVVAGTIVELVAGTIVVPTLVHRPG